LCSNSSKTFSVLYSFLIFKIYLSSLACVLVLQLICKMSEALTSTSTSGRIAKNAVILYLRSILVMVITLYTSRVVLKSLGVEDYGIYALVASILALMTTLRSSMSNCVSRFICYEMGQNNDSALVKIFNVGLYIHLLMALLVIILGETVGLWVLNNVLVIPESRMDAVRVVYQFSIIAAVFQVLIFHFSAVIVALERMSFFAYMSVVTAVLRLGIAFMIAYDFDVDKLEFYAFLIMLESLCSLIFHIFYCCRYTNIAKFKIVKDMSLFKNMISFSGWLSIGNMVQLFNLHGVALVMNTFYGVIVNAAMGIATQVSNAVYFFTNNFQLSFNPQLIKAYSQKNTEMFRQLIFISSKVIFFITLFMVLPIILNSEYILSLWLAVVPKYASEFLVLVLIYSAITSLSMPLWKAINATGTIRNSQLISSAIYIVILPLAYFLLDFGFALTLVLFARVLVNICVGVWLGFYAKNLFEFPVAKYFKEVWGISLIVVILSITLPISLSFLFEDNFIRFFVVSATLGLSMLLSMLYVGFNKKERKFAFKLLSNKFKFLNKFQFIFRC